MPNNSSGGCAIVVVFLGAELSTCAGIVVVAASVLGYSAPHRQHGEPVSNLLSRSDPELIAVKEQAHRFVERWKANGVVTDVADRTVVVGDQ